MPKNLRVNHEYVSMHPQNIITRLQSGESWKGLDYVGVVSEDPLGWLFASALFLPRT